MPYNDNVHIPTLKLPDATGIQFSPTADDYFRYYSEMIGKVTLLQVRDMIAGRTLTEDYVRKMHPTLLQVSDKLHNAFLDFCDKHHESLSGEKMMEFYMRLLHNAVCVYYLGYKPGPKYFQVKK